TFSSKSDGITNGSPERSSITHAIFFAGLYGAGYFRLFFRAECSAARPGRTALCTGRTRNVRTRRLDKDNARGVSLVRKTRASLLVSDRGVSNFRRERICRAFRFRIKRARNDLEFVDARALRDAAKFRKSRRRKFAR